MGRFMACGFASVAVCMLAACTAQSRPAERRPWVLSVSPGADATYSIHVADPAGREVQVIHGQEGDPPYSAEALLRLADFTGDGRPDILARGLSVGASALTSESIYVYDAASGRFLDRQPFEHEGEVSTTSPGCISVTYRNADNMTYSSDHYCWRGAWVPMQRTR